MVLLGESNSGKSSLIHRFANNEFVQQESTVGAAFIEHYKFELWDTAGQERYRSLAPMYYRGASAAIVVYDITSRKSFEGAKTWIKELRERADASIIIAIAGNKLDLASLREVDAEEASKYAAENNLLYLETSAKTAFNVAKLFEEIEKKMPIRKMSSKESVSRARRLSYTMKSNPNMDVSSMKINKSNCCR